MWRHEARWLATVLLVLGAPGCLGGGEAVDVGSRSSALSNLEGGFEEIANELVSEDCLDAGRAASASGHDVVWAVADLVGELALLEIDGVLACAAPTESLKPGERAEIILMQPVRPDPEPADPDKSRPDPEPASPDEARPDPEPASPDEARPDPEPASPDECRPDPEPAGAGTSGGCA